MTTKEKGSFFFDNDPDWTLEDGLFRAAKEVLSFIASILVDPEDELGLSEEEIKQEAWEPALQTLTRLNRLRQLRGPLAEVMIKRLFTWLEKDAAGEDGLIDPRDLILIIMEIALALFIDSRDALKEGRLNVAINCYAQGKLLFGIGKGKASAMLLVEDVRKDRLSKIAKARHQKNRNEKEEQKQKIINLWQDGHPTEKRGWRTITEAAEFAANHLPGVKFRTAQKWISEANKKP